MSQQRLFMKEYREALNVLTEQKAFRSSAMAVDEGPSGRVTGSVP